MLQTWAPVQKWDNVAANAWVFRWAFGVFWLGINVEDFSTKTEMSKNWINKNKQQVDSLHITKNQTNRSKHAKKTNYLTIFSKLLLLSLPNCSHHFASFLPCKEIRTKPRCWVGVTTSLRICGKNTSCSNKGISRGWVKHWFFRMIGSIWDFSE